MASSPERSPAAADLANHGAGGIGPSIASSAGGADASSVPFVVGEAVVVGEEKAEEPKAAEPAKEPAAEPAKAEEPKA